jgi:hypothetical protein
MIVCEEFFPSLGATTGVCPISDASATRGTGSSNQFSCTSMCGDFLVCECPY